ncbi:MAG: TIGR03960 family B12-binding radical SAM protein [Actinomycetota bacterium]
MIRETEGFLGEELAGVTRPGRYLGIEVNAYRKPFGSAAVTCALVYPDAYEIGMSHLGLSILYEEINEREDAMADRAYLPWVDMQEAMERRGAVLYGLESRVPLAEFDILGITLQHELTFANVVRVLGLAGMAALAAERGEDAPLVVGGGPGAYNPEPVAGLFDIIVLGEGEEIIHELIDLVKDWKKKGGGSREGLVRECAALPGVYVPSLYNVSYLASGEIAAVEPVPGAPFPVRKRLLADLASRRLPRRPVIPLVEPVHDRCSLEVFRGCTRGCRFCQAGMVYRPVRERPEEMLYDWAWELVRNTGCDEISLSSLNSADYSRILALAKRLSDEMERKHVAVSLPSLRTDTFSVELAARLRRVKRTGLTFAPEAASPRLRASMNKGVSDEDLLAAVAAAYREGWRKVKLYFMVGLPGESEDDVEEICVLVRRIMREGDGGGPARGLRLAVSVSTFVPKAHTPLQWARQMSLPEIARRHFLLRDGLHIKGVTLRWHMREMSYLEGVLARGDRRLLPAVMAASREGCLDSWSEFFSWERWQRAMAASGVDAAWYTERERPRSEVLPWDHLHAGVDRDFLWEEYEKARRGEETPDCRTAECGDCGACSEPGTRVRLAGGE